MKRFVWCLLIALPCFAQSPRASACFAACERHVTEPRLRATACALCVTHPGEPTAWLLRAPVSSDALMKDDAWEVRWAGVTQAAQEKKTTPVEALSQSITTASPLPAGERVRVRACQTAAHRAAIEKVALKSWLNSKAAALCLDPRLGLERALEVELYDESAPIRRAALLALSTPFEKTLARAVLDAASTHSAAFDGLLIDTLCEVTAHDDSTCAAQLSLSPTLSPSGEGGRLLEELSRRKALAVERFAKTDLTERREALNQLIELAPLTEAELLAALDDPERSIRVGAARGLARGEGSTTAVMVARRLAGEKPATRSQLEVLIGLTGDIHFEDCAPVLLAAWKTNHVPLPLRALVLETAASCDFETVRSEVEGTVTPETIRALAFAPKDPQLDALLLASSTNESAPLRAAAIRTLGIRRLRAATTTLRNALKDVAPAVRREAAGTFAVTEGDLVALLETDPDPSVRAAAARALLVFDTPRTRSALERASRIDADPKVKMVASQSLRRLGPGTLSP